MKTLFPISLSLSLVLGLPALPARAESGFSFSEALGLLGTLGRAYSSFMGTTTVTPGYALSSWRSSSYGTYHDIPYARHQACDADLVVMRYFYETRSLQRDGRWAISYDPFPLRTTVRQNYRCDTSVVVDGVVLQTNIANEVQDFEFAVHAARVASTGYFPPGPPYPAWVKSTATRVPAYCTDFATEVRPVRTGVSLPGTGWARARFGLVNYSYTWPPLVWVGDIYDY